jgi:hypothetical protein
MIGWFSSPLGRVLQGIVGIALLWIGMAQATAFGLLVMMTGLIATVMAAAPPAFLVPTPAIRTRSARPLTPLRRNDGPAR